MFSTNERLFLLGPTRITPVYGEHPTVISTLLFTSVIHVPIFIFIITLNIIKKQ